MYLIRSYISFALPLVIALTLGAAPQESEAASVCQKVRGVANKGCVRAKDVKKATVRAKHIKNGAVTADKLAAEALAGGRIPVADCGTIGQPGSYVLVNDMPGPLGLNLDGGCLVIEADDVTLDLAGFSIVGDGIGDDTRGDGVFMEGRSNVTVRNGTIRGFADNAIGVTTEQGPARNHHVSNIRAIGNGATGILLRGSSHQVTNCLSNANRSAGIRTGSGAIVVGNTARDNRTDGIDVGNDATVTGNTVSENGEQGISTGSGATVTGNTAKGNTLFGIDTASNSAIVGNVATGNDAGNIDTCTGCQVEGNFALKLPAP